MLKLWYELYIWVEKSDYKMIKILGALALGLGFYVYKFIYELPPLESFTYSTQLFAMDIKTPFELKEFLVALHGKDALCDVAGVLNPLKESASHWWGLIYAASLFATLTLVSSIGLLLFRNKISTFYLKHLIKEGSHTIVVGLGRNSRFFINSLLETEKHKVIVFERDKENAYIGQYKSKEIAVVTSDINEMLNDLNMENAKNIFISTGNDEQNIYLAMRFIAQLKDQDHKIQKLLVHIEDRTLRNLYDDGKALDKKNIDLRLFSFYKDSSRMLFQEHPLEGDDQSLMDSGEDFHIVIVGNSEFSISLIAEACKRSDLPKGNKLHIHWMGKDKEGFEKRVYYAFPQIGTLEHVQLHFDEVDTQAIEFYEHPVWKEENITHVIYADEVTLENIRIATKVSNITYLRDQSKIQKTKFHIATMNNVKIAEELRNEIKNKNVFTCAEANKVCSAENLLFNSTDEISKFIHYAYASKHFRVNDLKIHLKGVNRVWREASVNDKRASTAQAIHIDTKLKALGLRKEKATKETSLDTLYKANKRLLNAKLQADMNRFGLTKEKLEEMEEAYQKRKDETVKEGYFFPKKDSDTLLENLVRMEHNRWMTALKMMDYIQADEATNQTREVRKQFKHHHLLKPFSEFKTNEEKIYVINDLNTIKNIARYMALTGYALVEL